MKKRLLIGVGVAVLVAIPAIVNASTLEALCALFEKDSQYWLLFGCYWL